MGLGAGERLCIHAGIALVGEQRALHLDVHGRMALQRDRRLQRCVHTHGRQGDDARGRLADEARLRARAHHDLRRVVLHHLSTAMRVAHARQCVRAGLMHRQRLVRIVQRHGAVHHAIARVRHGPRRRTTQTQRQHRRLVLLQRHVPWGREAHGRRRWAHVDAQVARRQAAHTSTAIAQAQQRDGRAARIVAGRQRDSERSAGLGDVRQRMQHRLLGPGAADRILERVRTMARERDVRLHTRLATAAHHRIVVALRADKRRGRQGMCHVRERRPIQRHVSVIRVVQLEKAVRHTALGARPELELVARLVAHDALVPRRRAIALRLVHEPERRLALEIRERLDTHRAGTRIVDALKVDRGPRRRHVHDLARPRRADAAHAVRGRSALQRIHTRLTHMNRMRAPRERPHRMHSLPVVPSVDVLDVPLIVPALVHLHGHTQREAITRPQQLQRATRHTLLGIPMHLRLRMHIRCGCLVQIRHIAAHIADMAQLQRMRAGRRHIERDRRRRARRVMHQRPLATRMRIRQRQRRRAVQHDLPLRLVAHTVVRRGRYKRRTRTLDERDGLRHNVRRLRLPIQHRL